MAHRTTSALTSIVSRLPAARIVGAADLRIGGITHDSRAAGPGDLFVCLKGAAFDGHRFAAAALAQGAVALVVNESGLTATGNLPEDACLVIVPDTRQALPLLACALYGDPSHAMTMVGVTGTNGKTTTTRMLAAILRAAGRRVGAIGTLGAELDGTALPSEHTTPEADQLQGLLAQMRDRGAEAVVMEASSHALAQGRTDGIAFDAAIFTNLTQDHLDYHGTMDAYFEAKALLFTDYPARFPRPNGAPFHAVISVEAEPGRRLAELTAGKPLTFSADGSAAMLRAERIALTHNSADFDVRCELEAGEVAFHAQLPVGGAFQVGNALGAIGVAIRLGIAPGDVVRGLATLPPVPGRFETVSAAGAPFSVVVDYAHTPDGLENLLLSAKRLGPRRIVTVFGCGGNRDRTKRPIMGRIAGAHSDLVVVTSDNPRNEDPGAIIEEILVGLVPGPASAAHVLVEPDRRTAIHLALAAAGPGDMVLIAGKGHEDYQIVGDKTLHFDDREVAREWLNRENG